MATQAARLLPSDSSLPLYRMDAELYGGLVEAGALEGLAVELRDGLLVNRRPHREDAIHRLDVGTYERMVATGLLEGLPIELLEGLLVEVSPQGVAHADVIMRLTRHLGSARAWLRVQLPLEAEWRSIPEPDLALSEGQHPVSRHPRTALLAVEVMVSSHKQDRETKAKMYAWAPIPTYWLVDVPGRAVEVRSDPGPKGYGRCEVYGIGASVPSPAEGVPDLDVASLFEGFDE
ncbi:MAG TPA: Uma2 family endonuclease [Solirubrobacteraceae bacterium]|jgi:Uma2 family endonuclease|nr:Uma2 family endonuclease [Solirubrobacteraceae bacterium]